MKTLATLIAYLALIAVFAPSVLFLTGHLSHDKLKIMMLAATIVWFITAPIGMLQREKS